MIKYITYKDIGAIRPLQVIVDEFDNVVTVIYADQYQHIIANNPYLRKYNKNMLSKR